jgi:hypothetical protein
MTLVEGSELPLFTRLPTRVLLGNLEDVREDAAERVRGLYNYRRNRFSARFGGDEAGLEEHSACQRLLRELLRAQRITLLELRNEGVIGDEAMHRIERDLDLEESRMGA